MFTVNGTKRVLKSTLISTNTFIVNRTRQVLKTTLENSMKGLPKGPHVTRYYMYRHLSKILNTGERSGKILSISHSKNLCEFFDLKNSEIVEANYPDYNILALPFSDNEFDYVVSDQVLEHVEGDPQLAIHETWRVLKPGGIAIHTTCFINPIHDYPGDFWRFTPEALKLLCRKFSKIIDVNGWGNKYVWFVEWLGLRYEGIPDAHWHPLHKVAMKNDNEWPIVTWIVAQK